MKRNKEILKENITCVILAGGLSRRMGKEDKSFKFLNGISLIERVITQIEPQVGKLFINTNVVNSNYADLNFKIISDVYKNNLGPLDGIHAGLTHLTNDFLLTVPCDTPFLPGNLVEMLKKPLQNSDKDLSFAGTASQSHPVVILCKKKLKNSLENYLDDGGRKIDLWFKKISCKMVIFNNEKNFLNINTLNDLEKNSKIS